ncbi:DUF4433 domain-containing protein [Agrobacterium rubi]|nr:DUF4433 domain-containing protein [Agrobacterium rubi]NTF23874.1 DUF4433 domain-containing protein [Agrobacterium rubi]
MSRSADRIRGSARSRDIRHLLHFTQAANIPSIITHGLVSRLTLSEQDIDGFGSARHRIDQHDDAISVSVSAFNPAMFARKRKAAGRAPWVILALDPSVLWTHRCRFFARNAASREMLDHTARLSGSWAFDRLFSNDLRHHRYTGTDYRRETNIPDRVTTRPDAEVQVFDPIAPEAIIHAWTDRADIGRAVKEELRRVPGFERDVTVAEFTPRFSNGYSIWG